MLTQQIDIEEHGRRILDSCVADILQYGHIKRDPPACYDTATPIGADNKRLWSTVARSANHKRRHGTPATWTGESHIPAITRKRVVRPRLHRVVDAEGPKSPAIITPGGHASSAPPGTHSNARTHTAPSVAKVSATQVATVQAEYHRGRQPGASSSSATKTNKNKDKRSSQPPKHAPPSGMDSGDKICRMSTPTSSTRSSMRTLNVASPPGKRCGRNTVAEHDGAE